MTKEVSPVFKSKSWEHRYKNTSFFLIDKFNKKVALFLGLKFCEHRYEYTSLFLRDKFNKKRSNFFGLEIFQWYVMALVIFSY